jgi:hypothetical protein
MSSKEFVERRKAEHSHVKIKVKFYFSAPECTYFDL